MRWPEPIVRGNWSKRKPADGKLPAIAVRNGKKSAASVNVNVSAFRGVFGVNWAKFNIDVDFFRSSDNLFHHEVFDLGSS